MNMLSEIKITIGITTYNRPEFLIEAVNSVLQQSYKNFELIISNDFIETEITFENLGVEVDPRIKIFNQAKNLGEIKNMNFLLDTASSEWFVWLADDDLMHPDFLKYACEVIIKNKEKNIVGFFTNYISASKPEGIFPSQLSLNKPIYYGNSNFLLDYTSRKCPLIGCSGIMHKVTLRKIGGAPQLGNSFSPYNDTLIPILLLEYGRISWLDEPLIFLRTHSESLSCNSTEFSAYASAEVDFLQQLRRVCAIENITNNFDKIMGNTIRWFSKNEWLVLSRDKSVGRFNLMIKFVCYQVAVNLPRLSFKYRIYHFLFIVRMMAHAFVSRFFIKSSIEA